jgi:hypothetical protein
MDHRKTDIQQPLADRDEVIKEAYLAIEASEELLERVRAVAHAVEERVERVLEENDGVD